MAGARQPLCAGSPWGAAAARHGERRHSPRHRELEFTSVGNSRLNFLLRGRQQRRLEMQRSPGGHPSAQPHCSGEVLHSSRANRSCVYRTWIEPFCHNSSPATVQPCRRMCISLPRKTPSKGVVSLQNPYQTHLHIAKRRRSTVLASGKDFGRCA